MAITVNFVGCGRVGKTIGKLIASNNLATINAIVNASYENAVMSAEFIGQGLAVKSIADLPDADIYFITTSDGIIQSACNALVDKGKLKPGSIIVHCSGGLSSDILINAKIVGCQVASIHPIKSFANPQTSVDTFPGTYCAIEGDEEAINLISKLFSQFGANVFPINKENKSSYHAGGVMASNYLVTLHHHAVQCYMAANIEENTAKKIVSMLMNDALTNLKNASHQKALTGPIQRGDTQTVRSHVQALSSYPTLQKSYVSLGLDTLALTSHASSKLDELEDVLSSNQSSSSTYKAKF